MSKLIFLFLLAACGGSTATSDLGGAGCVLPDLAAVAPDLGSAGDMADYGPDAGLLLCSVDGNRGQCMDATVCGAQPAFTAVPGYCPGPSSVQCCVLTPNTANNPPVPAGWMLLTQSAVTPEMTTWAVDILHDPTDYPWFSVVLRTFGSTTVMARVEWHPPDFQNSAIHRGVTLYGH